MHLFCFGLGYVSSYIIKTLNSQWRISGSHTGQRESKPDEYIFNNQTKFNPAILDDITHILISIPPNEQGDPAFLSFIQDIKKLKKLKWIGYFSSTSVYGDHKGEWVTEKSLTDATNQLGRNRLIAEKQWLDSKLPVNIFRLSAIYGPKRSAIESVRRGEAMRIFKKDHFFSRIHVQDIAQIVQQVMTNPVIGEIYNLADDFPSPQHEVISFACKLLNMPEPKMINFADAHLSEMMLRYYAASKKISNQKIKQNYNFKIQFPSYKEGLENCLLT